MNSKRIKPMSRCYTLRPVPPCLPPRGSSAFTALLLASLCLHPAKSAAVSPVPGNDRSIWLWQSPDSAFGSQSIVGNPAREDAAIARLKAWGVTTVYGSYSSTESPQTLRAWNRKLNQNGIASYLLLAETEDLFPESWPSASNHITSSFLQFNRDSQPSERFTGLAFDIEPHIFPGSTRHPGWKVSDVITRRQYMTDLLQFFQNTRTLLDHNGETSAPIEATLPVWYAKLSGSIQWNNAVDRDQWFAQLTKVCQRLSIMAFEITSPTAILQRSHDEVALLHGRARIALRTNLGHEWNSVNDFWGATHTIEETTHQSIDIQDFARLAAEEAALPTRPSSPPPR
jgi:hypothetical protein